MRRPGVQSPSSPPGISRHYALLERDAFSVAAIIPLSPNHLFVFEDHYPSCSASIMGGRHPLWTTVSLRARRILFIRTIAAASFHGRSPLFGRCLFRRASPPILKKTKQNGPKPASIRLKFTGPPSAPSSCGYLRPRRAWEFLGKNLWEFGNDPPRRRQHES